MFFNEPELIFCLREIYDCRASLYLGKHEKMEKKKEEINNERFWSFIHIFQETNGF